MGPRFVAFAAVFYAALLGLAVVLGGRDVLTLGDPVLFNLAVGVVTACGTVASGLLLYRLSPTIRRISEELAPRLVDGAKRRDLVLVSIMSGVGEEALFRGALQPYLGIALTSILFGALHIGPDRRYLTWTFWAVGAGFLFGFLYNWTGGLAAPMTAHVLHNAATLLLWKRSRRKIPSLCTVPVMRSPVDDFASGAGSSVVGRRSSVVYVIDRQAPNDPRTTNDANFLTGSRLESSRPGSDSVVSRAPLLPTPYSLLPGAKRSGATQ